MVIIATFFSMSCLFSQEKDSNPKKKQDLEGVDKKVKDAIVRIKCDDNREVGAGIIIGINRQGTAFILTAAHVIKGFREVEVSFPGSGSTREGIIDDEYILEKEDVAIVKVETPPSGIKVMKFRKSNISRSDKVGALGFPEGDALTWTEGEVNSIQNNYIWHQAILKKGNSGGPLCDKCGHLAGMNIQLKNDLIIKDTIYTNDSLYEIKVDTLEAGQKLGVALSSVELNSTLEGFLGDVDLKKKWKVKKYCSFGQKMYRHPGYIVAEVAIIGAVIAAIAIQNGNGETTEFGSPPNPPGGK